MKKLIVTSWFVLAGIITILTANDDDMVLSKPENIEAAFFDYGLSVPLETNWYDDHELLMEHVEFDKENYDSNVDMTFVLQENVLGKKRKFVEFNPDPLEIPVDKLVNPEIPVSKKQKTSTIHEDMAEKLIPLLSPERKKVNKNEINAFDFINVVLWKFDTNTPWKQFPKGRSTYYERFLRWLKAGVWEELYNDFKKICNVESDEDQIILSLLEDIIAVSSQNKLEKNKAHLFIKLDINNASEDVVYLLPDDLTEEVSSSQTEATRVISEENESNKIITLATEVNYKRLIGQSNLKIRQNEISIAEFIEAVISKFEHNTPWTGFHHSCRKQFNTWYDQGLWHELYKLYSENIDSESTEEKKILLILEKIITMKRRSKR